MRLVLVLVQILVLVGCSGYSITGGPGEVVAPNLKTSNYNAADLLRVNSLLVLPVAFDSEVGSLTEGEISTLEESLVNAVNDLLRMETHTGEVVKKALERESQSFSNQLRGYEPLGRSLGADTVLETRIHRIIKRVGSRVGVSQPALVDFSMSLVRSSDDQVIWQGNYFYRDQALSDNLFLIGERLRDAKENQRFGWLSADEIFARGVRETLESIAKSRDQSFQDLK